MKLLYLTATWVSGLLLGMLIHPNLWPILATLIALSVITLPIVLLRRRSAGSWTAMTDGKTLRLTAALLLASLFLLGLLRSDSPQPSPALDLSDASQQVRLQGVVDNQPESSGNAFRFVLKADSLDRGDGWQNFNADVLITARPNPNLVLLRDAPYIRYGDRLVLEGDLEPPPILDTFDYRDYLARQGIHLVMDFPGVDLKDEGLGSPPLTTIYNFRESMAHSLERALPEPHPAVAQTLLLGHRDNLTTELREDFRRTGTSHLLAISGLHVGVVLVLTIAASASLLGRRGPYFLLVPLLAIWLYALLSGMSPSVTRAAIMGTIYLSATALGRPRNVFPALALAAGVMAGLEPSILRDLSFQLSFAAVAGIALLAPPLTNTFQEKLRLTHERQGFAFAVARGALLSALVSVAATLATLPLVAFHFHQMPTLGIPATVLALPVLPAILLTSGLTVLAHAIHPTLGQVVGWTAYIPITYLTSLVQAFAAIPGGLIEIPRFNGLLVWLYYTPLAVAVLIPLHTLNSARRIALSILPSIPFNFDWPNLKLLIPTTALFMFAVVAWAQFASAPDGRLHVIFLDVDQGDGILIVTPSGQRALVDGGPDPVGVIQELNAHLPFWDRHLDLVISTHADEDHLAGLVGVIQRHPVDVVVEGVTASSPLFLSWRQALEERSIEPITVYRGAIIDLGNGLNLNVLNPTSDATQTSDNDANNQSVVLRLQYGEISFLLTGDIEEEVELELIREKLPLTSTVLKVSHHGSKGSSSPFFLRAVDPTVAVIQSGEDNRFGHPHQEVITRLQEVVGKNGIYVTSLHGAVELTTDGQSLWVKSGD